MKEFFKTNDWDVENEDILHFQSKSNIMHKKTKKKKPSKSKSKTNLGIDDNSETTIPLLKNSPLLKNVSSIKKTKNSANEVSKSSKLMLKKNDNFCNELTKKVVKSNSTKVQTSSKQKVNKNKKTTKNTENSHKSSEDNDSTEIEKITITDSPESNLLKQDNFKEKLKETLKGGRFRFLNERLYTMKGEEAKEMFEKDSTAFASYHEGYRQQVEKWPFNPLNRMIKKIRKSPKEFVIADFGCGEALLAQSIKQKCFSIDLVSARDDVIACDMSNTPLATSSIDIALYCLSLMGTNLNDFLLEANRVLKVGGFLYIAEIASRFDNVKNFLTTVEKFGFKLIMKDLRNKFFYFFDLQKETNCSKNIMNEIELTLKPCIYKKR